MKQQPVRIVVIGSMNMDLVAVAPRIALPGETIISGKFSTMPGGKGANQAVAANRLGAQVHMAGCIGDDGFGRELLDHMTKEGINTDYVTAIAGVSSGVAMITVSESGENSIVVSPGANAYMSPAHVRLAEPTIQEADLVMIQLEIPIEAVAEAAAIANRYGVPIILNPAPARQLPEALLSKIDVLTPNETEGKLIVTGKAEGDVHAEELIPALQGMGIQRIVMTLGSDGVAFSDGAAIRRLKAHSVQSVDTTGA